MSSSFLPKSIAAALLITFVSSFALGSTPFKNLDEVAQRLRLATYAQSASQRTVKIAILDNGFHNYAKELGQSLPATTVFHAGPVPVDAKTEESHGLFMAQIVSGLLAKTPKISYELHLFSAFGYSNLKSAIDTAVSEKFDVVLYSQVWEYGGNGDGRGFINALVNHATTAGMVWINAAGNFGDTTYRAAIDRRLDDWAYLPSVNGGVRVRCFENAQKVCRLRAVLTWNDFKDDSTVGTDKDLDLVLTDDAQKILKTGGLQQVKSIPPQASAGLSLYPREIIEAELNPGIYELRVKIRSQNFSKTDELRIVTSGDYLEQYEKSDVGETLLAPADNANVITIGASDSEKSSASRLLGKPEISLDSKMTLANGDNFKGSSNSAAMAAVLAVIAKALDPSRDRAGVQAFLAGRNSPSGGGSTSNNGNGGLSLEALQFRPTGPGCFRAAILPVTPDAARGVLMGGAVAVETTSGYKIMTATDPFAMGLGPQRKRADDMLVVDAKGFTVRSRSTQGALQAGAYEIVQKPRGTSYCQF